MATADESAPKGEDEPEAIRGISIPLKVNVTDLLGLGKAAKSRAGEEIAKAFSNLLAVLTEPSRTLLVGFAETKVETHRITATASAKAKALEIEVDAFERMKQRVVATELRRQLNIETITAEAIENLNRDHADDASRPIDDEWMANWIEGAKEASAMEVQSMWARLLEERARADGSVVSGPSLLLLRNLDGNLARAFADFVSWMRLYRCYPLDQWVQSKAVSNHDLAILEEIGFVKRDVADHFNFGDFRLRYIRPLLVAQVWFTYRSKELAQAIYGTAAPLSTTGKAEQLIRFIEEAMGHAPPLCEVVFDAEGKTDVAVRPLKSSTISSHDLPSVMNDLNARGAKVSEVAFAVLRGLHENGTHLQVASVPKSSS